MKTSVIIATKNEQNNIKRLLASLKKQTEKSCEIIVVDNYSQDKTREIAKKYTRHVYSKGKERSQQRNYGLKKAKGQYVIFLDADMQLEKNVLKECIEKIRNKNTKGIIIDEISNGKSYLAKIKNLEKELYRDQGEIEAARFFRKKDLDKIGGYDDNLISGEDWDISIRTSKLGPLLRIKSKIIHNEEKTFWQDIKKKYYYAKNIERYAKKHPEEFKKQSGFFRFSNLFKKPAIIYHDPTVFAGLILLKSAQYFAYIISRWTKSK